MNFQLIFAVSALLFFAVSLALALPMLISRAITKINRARGIVTLCNGLADGIHEDGVLTKTADAALGRYRLVIQGALATSVAVAGAADRPFGITDDETATTTDYIPIKMINCNRGTVRMISDGSAAIAVGDLLVPAVGGAVKTVAAGAGNYYIVGRALEAVANGATDTFEVSPGGYGLTK